MATTKPRIPRKKRSGRRIVTTHVFPIGTVQFVEDRAYKTHTVTITPTGQRPYVHPRGVKVSNEFMTEALAARMLRQLIQTRLQHAERTKGGA